MSCKRGLVIVLMTLNVAVAMAALDLEAAAAKVQKEVEGRVLGGKTVKEGDRTIYVIRVLTSDGRVRHIRVEAQSGKILKESSKQH